MEKIKPINTMSYKTIATTPDQLRDIANALEAKSKHTPHGDCIYVELTNTVMLVWEPRVQEIQFTESAPLETNGLKRCEFDTTNLN